MLARETLGFSPDISRILQTDVDKRKTEGISSDRKHFKQTLIETTKQTPAKRNN